MSWQAKLINAFIPISKSHGVVLQLVLHWEILAGNGMAKFHLGSSLVVVYEVKSAQLVQKEPTWAWSSLL